MAKWAEVPGVAPSVLENEGPAPSMERAPLGMREPKGQAQTEQHGHTSITSKTRTLQMACSHAPRAPVPVPLAVRLQVSCELLFLELFACNFAPALKVHKGG